MNKENPIGIFDSGIGGATVLKEILKLMPNENYIYYSDSLNNPYGDRNKEDIIKICDNITNFLKAKNCKIIVIACNTASANAADFLRKKYTDLSFIAIEPAYKMVYDYAYNTNTLIMATKGTIESEKFNLLLKKYDNKRTILLPCSGLADLIEQGNDKEIKNYLSKILSPYKERVQNVVLGCTHYPLIEDKIRSVLGDVKFFNRCT